MTEELMIGEDGRKCETINYLGDNHPDSADDMIEETLRWYQLIN